MILKDKAGPVPDVQRKLLEEAEKSCARLSALLAELSDVGYLESGRVTLNRGRVELDTLLREVADTLPSQVDRAITVHLSEPLTGAMVSADATRLRQALLALARAVTRENVKESEVRIAPRVDRAASHVIIGIGSPAGLAALSDGADALGAFDEFRGGYGMLLPVARRVIEAHGGTLAAPSGDFARIAAQVTLPL
jgi:signal transduction histidine kinase